MTTQPTPDVTGVDVERVVRRDFPADRVAEVLVMLNEYGTEAWQREPHRVHLAVLKLEAVSGLADTMTEPPHSKTDARKRRCVPLLVPIDTNVTPDGR
jgi:hypothetical protein